MAYDVELGDPVMSSTMDYGMNSNHYMNYSNYTIQLDEEDGPNLWCLALVLFPLTCIFGNVLVVLAVMSERSLKTSTNFLLLSLACADLLIGTLVMPFSIYLTINRLRWFLPEHVCNFFCVVDVSASTSSIVHLVAISIDRFYAVVRHMEYKSPRHKNRVYSTILFSWVFSIGIGLPLGIGLNHGRAEKSEYECGIVNTDYMLYSSIFAFYIPCLVMTIMYSFVFYKLHRRMRAVKLQEMAAGQMVQFGDNLGNILQHAYGNKENLRQASLIWAVPILKTLEDQIAENEDMSTEELDELTTILHTLETDSQHRTFIAKHMEGIPESPENSTAQNQPQSQNIDPSAGKLLSPKPAALKSSRLTTILYSMSANGRRRRRRKRLRRLNLSKTNSNDSNVDEILRALSTPLNAPNDAETSNENEGKKRSETHERRRRQSLYVAKQKIRSLKERAIEILMKMKSKQGMAIRKETRATKLVCTVMLVFLICWTPFFTLNIYKVFNLRANTWTYELESLFIFFTWLGYLNSCLNPIIYSLFNRKFRGTFQRLLHCPTKDAESPLHRNRRLYSRPFIGDQKDQKRTCLLLAQRRSTSPRKTGMQENRLLNRFAPKNGILAKSTAAEEASRVTSSAPVSPTEREFDMKKRKITWQAGAPQVIIPDPITEKSESKSEHQNGTDMIVLRRIQSLRSEKADSADFTEPVEV